MLEKYIGTATLRNLENAFATESKARNKYTYFASVAKKEGLNVIADLFLETANNEKEHAEIWYKELFGLGDTQKCLKLSADAEEVEWTEMYKKYAREAEEEGLYDIAEKFRLVAEIERRHEKRFRDCLVSLKENQMFEKSSIRIWQCTNCGHIEIGFMAPEECPVCYHAKGYFKICDDECETEECK